MRPRKVWLYGAVGVGLTSGLALAAGYPLMGAALWLGAAVSIMLLPADEVDDDPN